MGSFIKPLTEITSSEVEEAGQKAANIGKLDRADFNIPPGFCLLSKSFFRFLEYNNLLPQIETIEADLNYEDYGDLERKTAEIRTLITNSNFPKDLESELDQSIGNLPGKEHEFVTIRASLASKGDHVFAPPAIMGAYHYLKGKKFIIGHIKMCWSYYWTSKATLDRHSKKGDQHRGCIAPIIQKMVNSRVAGILYTSNPHTGSKNEIMIEASWGLGDLVIAGESLGDSFVLDKSMMRLKDKRAVKKTVMVFFDEKKGIGSKEGAVDSVMMDAYSLTEGEIRELGEIGLRIEKIFRCSQEIDWAYENKALYILGSRDIKNRRHRQTASLNYALKNRPQRGFDLISERR